jgi:pimeloyl-ACP methyl ester carboxylesterase
MNEPELIQRVEAADAAEFRRILRDVTPEQARALKVHFGDERFERLRDLAKTGETRGASRGNVIVLHGILGGELTILSGDRRDRIWISIRHLLLSGFLRLKLEGGNGTTWVEPTGILKKYYGEQLLRLQQQGWTVRPFWYDWRRENDASATRLRDRVLEWFPDQRVHLVAHSMGGLVARSFVRQYGDLWAAMGGKLIMLGTPNYGSFSVPQLLCGFNSVAKMVDLLDVRNKMDAVLRVVQTFPSTYEMLPDPHYFESDLERDLWNPERYPARPEAGKFERAREFRNQLKAIADPERMIYIAGSNQPTAVGIRNLDRLGFRDGYEYSMAGDGTVPHRLGLLRPPDGGEPYQAFYADCEHGAMPNNELIGDGVSSLLGGEGQGRLRTDPALKSLSRSESDSAEAAAQAEADVTAWDRQAQLTIASLQSRGGAVEAEIDTAPLTEAERHAEELMVEDFLGSGTRGGAASGEAPSRRVPASTTPADSPRLTIRVIHGSIQDGYEDSVDSISVGHYVGTMPSASEGALSDALTGDRSPGQDSLIGELTRRGVIHGELGEIYMLPDPRDAKRLVFLAGMGYPGKFGQVELRSCVRQLLWTVSRLGKLHLATVLIGAGAGSVPPEEAVRGWLNAIEDMLSDGKLPAQRLERITLAEISPLRARRLHKLIQNSIAALGLSARIKLDPEPEIAEQAFQSEVDNWLAKQRRQFEEDEPGAEGSAVSRLTTTYGGGRYAFSALTVSASIPERIIPLDKPVVDDANNQFPTLGSAEAQRSHGKFFNRLLLPEDFEPVFRTPDPVVVVCDASTASVHWEMITMPDALAGSIDQARGFFGLDRGLTRQFKTTFASLLSRPSLSEGPTFSDGILRVLIVIDPAQDRRLPAAEKEGNAVAKFFFRLKNEWQPQDGSNVRGLEVRVLHGPSEATRLRVLQELLDTSYDILHYAGHCVYDKTDPMRSGWIFSNGSRLTANELRRVGQVPSFIFSNACESGIAPDRSELRNADLPATFAEAFLAQGVQNFICTAWPVNDEAACCFAETFYEACIRRDNQKQTFTPLYKAMSEARKKVLARPDGIRSWGAYQHYGDPFARLF